MLKRLIVIALTAAMAITALGCSCSGGTDESSVSTVSATETKNDDEAKVDELGAEENAAEADTESTKPESKEEKAVKDNKLTVDEEGNVVDEDGNKLEVDEDGNVTVKTDDGQTIKVNTNTIEAVNSSNGSSSNNSNTSNTSSKPSSSTGNTNTSSKPSTDTGNTSSSDSKPSSSSSTTSSTTSSSSKTWHEAVYEYIEHPAVTEEVWVVDQAAYTYEEPVYETQWRTICYTCGEDITENASAHGYSHMSNGENFSYGNEPQQVQVGTETITVPEQGHYETQVVKEAWTEKVLVKEAGWY